MPNAGVPPEDALDLGVPVWERPGFFARVSEIVGIRRLRTEHDLARLVERRLPAATVDALRRSGLADDEIHALVIPRRTLAHRRARREPLSRDESDRVVRVARIAALAERVFGDTERAWRWLRAPVRRLPRPTRLELLATEAGARIVEEWLYRIDDGMAA